MLPDRDLRHVAVDDETWGGGALSVFWLVRMKPMRQGWLLVFAIDI